MKRLQAIFHGYVQGVGFRFAVEKISRQFAVTGYVRNMTNGTVEVVAEGQERELQEFLQALRQSSLGPNILDVEVTWPEASGQWRNFTVKV
jgi:acylphosphatase